MAKKAKKNRASSSGTPKMEGVTSTAIRGVGHAGRNLDIEFRSGAKYRYHGVSPRVATNLKKASSVGRHFVRNVRNNYSFDKLRAASSTRGKKRKGHR